MDIRTKFNIGEAVYFIGLNENPKDLSYDRYVGSGQVNEIVLTVDENNKSVITYNVVIPEEAVPINFIEHCLYSTEEEVIGHITQEPPKDSGFAVQRTITKGIDTIAYTEMVDLHKRYDA